MFSVWILTATALFVDSSYGYLHGGGLLPQQCYECPRKGPCDDEADLDKPSLPVRQCPNDRPYCGTYAEYPSFRSVIGCVSSFKNVCALHYSGAEAFSITCYCRQAYCNAPFTLEMRKMLTNFALLHVPLNASTDISTAFWRTTRFHNVSQVYYNLITVELTAKPSTTTAASTLATTLIPVKGKGSTRVPPVLVQALHNEPAALPTDDEEEGEGSGAGADDDERPSSSHAPSSAAHPAENGARPLFIQVLVTIPMFGLFLM